MEDRVVTHVTQNRIGEILALCNPDADWSPRRRQDAIDDIELEVHGYRAVWPDGESAPVYVGHGRHGKALRADHPGKDGVGLKQLPDISETLSAK